MSKNEDSELGRGGEKGGGYRDRSSGQGDTNRGSGPLQVPCMGDLGTLGSRLQGYLLHSGSLAWMPRWPSHWRIVYSG